MARVRLRLARSAFEGLGVSLVVKLVRLGENALAVEQRRVVAPGSGELALDLAPGHWLMEATLPSGESLSESFEVSAADSGQVELGSFASAATALGWQQLLGVLPMGPVAAALGAATTRGLRQDESGPGPRMPELESVPDDIRILGDLSEMEAHDRGPVERLLRGDPHRDFGVGRVRVPEPAPDDVPRDGTLALPGDDEREPSRSPRRARARLAAVTTLGVLDETLERRLMRDSWTTAAVSRWLDVQTHDGREQYVFAAQVPRVVPPAPLCLVPRPIAGAQGPRLVAALPWPWPGVAGEAPAAVEALVAPTARAYDVSIAVRDARFGPALGYLAAGDLSSAALLVDDVTDALFERLDNPLAAAAAGYILLGAWQRAAWASKVRRPLWFDWTDALTERAAWLPDGAILRGWLELRGQAAEPDLARARAAFLTALQRGLPYYTAGVRRLYDGLALLRQDQAARADVELERAHATARWLSLRVDPRQAFCVVRMTDG